MKSGIYQIRNLVTDSVYIGLSKNIKTRWEQHKSLLNSNSYSGSLLQRDWNILGSENFSFEIIELCSEDILFEREKYWINTKRECDAMLYNDFSGIALDKYRSKNYAKVIPVSEKIKSYSSNKKKMNPPKWLLHIASQWVKS